MTSVRRNCEGKSLLNFIRLSFPRMLTSCVADMSLFSSLNIFTVALCKYSQSKVSTTFSSNARTLPEFCTLSVLDLQFDVSAIDAFAPFARAALLQMLGPSPPMRTLGKAKAPSQGASLGSQGKGEGAGNGLSRAMSAPVKSLSSSSSRGASNVSSLDSSSGLPSHGKVALKARGKGNSPPTPTGASTGASTTAAPASPPAPAVESLWSPSRLVALLPPDPAAFELVEAATSWAMDHTAVCDALLHLAGTVYFVYMCNSSRCTMGVCSGCVCAALKFRGSFAPFL